MRICFIIFVAGIRQAAEAPPEGKHITSVVRADPRTGRLVRSVIVTPKTGAGKGGGCRRSSLPERCHPRSPPRVTTPEAAAGRIDEAVDGHRTGTRCPAALIHSVIRVESNYNPNAVSPKGAQGLMQLIPATARRFGVGDVFNPLENMEGGAQYLSYLLDLYGDDYAAGSGGIQRRGGGSGEVRDRAAVSRNAELPLVGKQQLDKKAESAPVEPAAARNPRRRSSSRTL